MTIVTALMSFAVIWWLVFFTVLPIGIERDKKPQKGNDPGAPKSLGMRKKLVLTTIIAIVITLILYWIVNYSGLKLSQLPGASFNQP